MMNTAHERLCFAFVQFEAVTAVTGILSVQVSTRRLEEIFLLIPSRVVSTLVVRPFASPRRTRRTAVLDALLVPSVPQHRPLQLHTNRLLKATPNPLPLPWRWLLRFIALPSPIHTVVPTTMLLAVPTPMASNTIKLPLLIPATILLTLAALLMTPPPPTPPPALLKSLVVPPRNPTMAMAILDTHTLLSNTGVWAPALRPQLPLRLLSNHLNSTNHLSMALPTLLRLLPAVLPMIAQLLQLLQDKALLPLTTP